MSAVGIITEYNPFHNGHARHIEQSKELTGADTVVCVMSGNFVQRGLPAVTDKYSRAKMALMNGVDLCVELPAAYACASAEYFAFGSVATLHALGLHDICFGSELGTVKPLYDIASILVEEPEEYKNTLKLCLTRGMSFPKARSEALRIICPEYADILLQSNNILGTEYIKAIISHSYHITPHTIRRGGASYNSDDILSDTPSANAIRKHFETAPSAVLKASMPENVYDLLAEMTSKTFPVYPNDFSAILNAKLLQLFHAGTEPLFHYADIMPKLANRIKKHFTGTQMFDEFAGILHTKNIAYTSVCRSLIHILLEITEETHQKFFKNTVPPYIRLLGFTQKGQSYLNHIKKDCPVPIVTGVAEQKDLLREDIFAANLYNVVIKNKFNYVIKDEYRQNIIRI